MTPSRITLVAAALVVAVLSAPASAAPKKAPKPVPAPPSGPPDASFYEVTETMKLLVRKTGVPTRAATAALLGMAKVDTPFCPRALAESVMQAPVFCSLNAVGRNSLNLQTGLGPFHASLDIVVQGDNPVDGPEFLVGEMNVTGRMDFSPALFGGLPYGTVAGTLQGKSLPKPKPAFIGVFRLPFLGSDGVRGQLCPLTPGPNPHFPPEKDYVYVDATATGSLTGRCIDITPDELALGLPTVRFDIWFK
ncbi:MAG: hypothetical protein FJ027_13850 [Candidatus Rokubacteria bacterium]|nr:hypothetical protein [Candidatus Rokubacteria bacterium]